MKSKRLIGSGLAAVLVLVLMAGLAAAQAPASTPLGTGFTYQGQLKSSGAPYTGSCDFRLSLWDALTEGTQIGTTLTKTNVGLVEGYFTLALDFGSGRFQGDGRWLDIQVRCPAGDGSYTPPTPRQELTAAPYALYAQGAWQTSGNAGTTPGTNYLGTSDWAALELKVNGARALRIEPKYASPNLIGGYGGNWVIDEAYGAVIGGGGFSNTLNRVTDAMGTVSGGGNNQAGDNAGTVEDAAYATVGGGAGNTALGWYSTIGGGLGNSAGHRATVAGGVSNSAGGLHAAVGGGGSNSASGLYATVGGGYANAASQELATVCGGANNTASGLWSTVAGGANNTAQGLYSFAAGWHAQAYSEGAFVWSDTSPGAFSDAGEDTFNVRATNGAHFRSNNASAALNVHNDQVEGGGIWAFSTGTWDNNVWDGTIEAVNEGSDPALSTTSEGVYSAVFGNRIWVQGSCDGCVSVFYGLNTGTDDLRAGDLAAISGVTEPLAGNPEPVLAVRRAATGEAVVGVVQSRGILREGKWEGGVVGLVDRAEGDAARGDYLFLVVYGPAQVRADASSGAIVVGTRLAAGEAGAARALQTRTIEGMVVAEAAQGVGIALESLDAGTGLIWVMVTLH